MSAKKYIKHALYNLSCRGGVNRYLRRKHRSQLLILNYHGVVMEEYVHGDLTNSVDAFLHRNAMSLYKFRQQLQTILKQFQPISAQEVFNWFDGRGQLPQQPVLITFDDGFANNARIAAPELEKLGIPVVFNLTTGYINTQRILWPLELDQLIIHWPHKTLPLPGHDPDITLPASPVERCGICQKVRNLCKSLSNSERVQYLDALRTSSPLNGHKIDDELNAFMTWDDVRSLLQKGFSIGSHTVEHPILTNLDRDEMSRELRESKQLIEQETGTACQILAYPNGGPDDFSPQVVDEAKSAGYKLAFTLIRGFNQRTTPALQLNRVNLPSDLSLAEFEAFASGLYTLLKGPT